MAANGVHGANGDANAAASGQQAAAAGVSAGPQPSWLESLQGLLQELPGLVSDRIELLSLELQRAARVLAQIVALIVATAILAVTAWLALWGGVLMAMIAAGLHWAVASLIVLVINLGATWWAVARIRALAPLLKLPATRRHLSLKPLSPNGPQPPADEHTPHPTANDRAH